MKKFLSIIAIFVFACIANAEVKVGVLVSPQLNESLGVRVGADISVPINERWSIDPGVYWSLRNRNQKAYKESGGVRTDYKYEDKAHFLTIPVRMGVRLIGDNGSNFNMNLQFGPYVAFGLDGTSKTISTTNGTETSKKVGAFDKDGRYNTRVDYGVNFGLKLLIHQHFIVGEFTEIGCNNIYNSNGITEEIFDNLFIIGKINIAAGITLGYQF